MCSIYSKNASPVTPRGYITIIMMIIASSVAGGTFIGCSGASRSDEPEVVEQTGNGKIELVKVDSIVLDPGDQMIGRFLEYMRVNDEGTVLLFADLMNQQLFLFNRQGKLINTIGSEGSGPEEFLQIISFDVDDGRVVVADESLYVVKIFSLEGELLNSFRLFEGEDLVITSFDTHVADRWLYVPVVELKYSNEKSKSAIVAKIDLNTGGVAGLIGKYDPYVKVSNHYHNIQRFAIDEKNQQIITSPNKSPRIQIIDLASDMRIKYFFAETPDWQPLREKVEAMMTRQQIREMTRGSSHVNNISTNERFIFQSFQTLTKQFQETKDPLAKKNMMALYNRNGEAFYGTVELPGLLGAVHGDQLFIIENVNPDQYTIGIYEINLGQSVDHSAVSAGSVQ